MWQKTNNSLYRKFEFKDFDEAFDFVSQVAQIAGEFNHHPKITNVYNCVELWLTSHDAGNKITGKDTEFASRVDEIIGKEDSKISHSKEGQSVKGSKISEKGVSLAAAKLFTDGGSRGNPGPSAIGYVILDMEDNVVKKESAYLGVTTNNQAEYQALKAGLEDALNLGAEKLEVYLDSLLVVNQVNGKWKMKNQELVPHHQAIRQLMPRFKRISFTHVPRAMNALADAMVNECLDGQ